MSHRAKRFCQVGAVLTALLVAFRNPFPPRFPTQPSHKESPRDGGTSGGVTAKERDPLTVDPTIHGTGLITDPAKAAAEDARAKKDLSTARALLRRVAKAQDRLGRKGPRDHALVLMDSCDDLADAMDREASWATS